MNQHPQSKITTTALVVVLFAASCGQSQLATAPPLTSADPAVQGAQGVASSSTSRPATSTPTTASTSPATTAPPDSSSSTSGPIAQADLDVADLLAGDDAADVQADLDAGSFTTDQIRQRSADRVQIRRFLVSEDAVYNECVADVDACDPSVVLPTIYDGELLVDRLTTIESLQGQGLRVTQPDPDPSMRVISNIRFSDDTHTEAIGTYCSIEADILTISIDGQNHQLAETIERQVGEVRLALVEGEWKMTDVQMLNRTDGETTCT